MTLLSPWAKHIDFDDPLNEYPRMQLQRGSFTSLNGIWEFTITDGSEPRKRFSRVYCTAWVFTLAW